MWCLRAVVLLGNVRRLVFVFVEAAIGLMGVRIESHSRKVKDNNVMASIRVSAGGSKRVGSDEENIGTK